MSFYQSACTVQAGLWDTARVMVWKASGAKVILEIVLRQKQVLDSVFGGCTPRWPCQGHCKEAAAATSCTWFSCIKQSANSKSEKWACWTMLYSWKFNLLPLELKVVCFDLAWLLPSPNQLHFKGEWTFPPWLLYSFPGYYGGSSKGNAVSSTPRLPPLLFSLTRLWFPNSLLWQHCFCQKVVKW